MAQDWTTIKVSVPLRDKLSEVAAEFGDGVALHEAIDRLLHEHTMRRIVTRYNEILADPDERAALEAEYAEWDAVTGDSLLGEPGAAA